MITLLILTLLLLLRKRKKAINIRPIFIFSNEYKSSINEPLFDELVSPLTKDELLELCKDNVHMMKQCHIDLLNFAYNGQYDFYLTMGYVLNQLGIVREDNEKYYRRWSYVFRRDNAKRSNRTHNNYSIA